MCIMKYPLTSVVFWDVVGAGGGSDGGVTDPQEQDSKASR